MIAVGIKFLSVINNLFVFLVILACLTLAGCHFNSTYNNREVDKKDGEKVVAKFYELLKNKDYRGTYTFFDKRFFEVTDTQKLNDIYNISFEKLGNIESYVVEQWETQTVVGTDAKTDYVFLCNVKRANFVAKETIKLTKENNEIKIIGYHVNSEGFLKKG